MYYDDFDWRCPMCGNGHVEVFELEDPYSYTRCPACGWQGVAPDFVGEVREEERA